MTVSHIHLTRRNALKAAIGAGLAVAMGGKLGGISIASAAIATDGTEAGWTKFNLNAASDEQFLSVPGTGDRMLREFNEYKPYTSVTQFTKEIGKYVESDVVDGYLAYLFVPIDPNSADADTLKQLPGVTDDVAKALTDARPFADDAAFLAKLGESVSAAQAESAKDYLASTATDKATWVKFNLNSASEDQFKTLPGVGDKMLKEFDEYKPYTTISQFATEIGKYVESDVVDGYLAYLFVPIDPNNADADTLKQLPGVTDDVVKALTDARPYADHDAFLAKLGESVSADQVELAKSYLVA